jgi:hypothetical protein
MTGYTSNIYNFKMLSIYTKQAYKIGKNIISKDPLYNNFNGKVLFNSRYSLFNIANLLQ